MASAQWTVINLSPAGATGPSAAYRAHTSQQFGSAQVGGVTRASKWSSSAGSWLDLNPAGATESSLYDDVGGYQVGYAIVGGVTRASMWRSTAASWVSLHPAGATESSARGVYIQQVGYAIVSGVRRASLWNGSAASWVDLSPAGSTQSQLNAVRSPQQVGYAIVGGVKRAGLWSGSAASWVDLGPTGATGSEALGMYYGQQVGYAQVGGVTRASLWSGSAASWIDLSPAGSTESVAEGVSDFGEQVGYAIIGGVSRAGLWSGTAASWEALSLFPTGSWAGTVAQSISSDGGYTYVAGWGFNITTGRNEALLWKRRNCDPTSITQQPAPATACPNGSALFNVSANGSVPLSFQWQIQTSPGIWVGMGNDPGPLPCGGGALAYASPINSPAVGIGIRRCPGDLAQAQRFQIRCVVTSTVGCGSAISHEATYTICPADFNCSGGSPTVADIFAFLPAWFTSANEADFNNDQQINSQDIYAFLSAWFGGC